VFSRNNVLIVIHASTNITKEIALEIDQKINEAPIWEEGPIIPSFLPVSNY